MAIIIPYIISQKVSEISDDNSKVETMNKEIGNKITTSINNTNTLLTNNHKELDLLIPQTTSLIQEAVAFFGEKISANTSTINSNLTLMNSSLISNFKTTNDLITKATDKLIIKISESNTATNNLLKILIDKAS
jgi:hypothetical protein